MNKGQRKLSFAALKHKLILVTTIYEMHQTYLKKKSRDLFLICLIIKLIEFQKKLKKVLLLIVLLKCLYFA